MFTLRIAVVSGKKQTKERKGGTFLTEGTELHGSVNRDRQGIVGRVTAVVLAYVSFVLQSRRPNLTPGMSTSGSTLQKKRRTFRIPV